MALSLYYMFLCKTFTIYNELDRKVPAYVIQLEGAFHAV